MKSPTLPERIICLTEESVELLYLLGESHRIIGVSQYAVRPEGVKKEKQVVSVFTHANQKKVLELKPDLVIGYSDIQKDIARDLIEQGLNVWVSNHRTLEETINYCFTLSSMIGAGERFLEIYSRWQNQIQKAKDFSQSLKKRPKIYLEEWDEPLISGISYFSELVELCGGEDIFSDLRSGFLAKERFPKESEIIKRNPEMILPCWCGKPVNIESVKKREGWEQVEAVREGRIYELPPEIFLQPGPALFESGIDYLIKLFKEVD
jgi:iron complex transport system substrate-binding protein